MSDGSQDPGGSPYESPQTESQIPQTEPKPGGMPTKDECNSAMLAHLLGAIAGIIGPLIIYLTKKDESPFVEDQGKEAMNFHITLIIAYVVSSILWTILAIVTCGIGGFIPLPAAVWIWQIVLGIIASTKASKGEYYRYPATMRLVT